MGEPSIDTLHDQYEDQLSAARYKAERDQLRQRLQGLEEWTEDLEDSYHAAWKHLVETSVKAKRLGRLVWKLQNRLARSHRREKQLRKGMREWRDKVMGAPVRTMSAYDLLPEEDLQALRWVREQGGLDVVKTHAELFQQLKGERDELRELARDYEKGLMPEGVKWPRYESGELVEFGDDVIGHFCSDAIKVRSVEFMRGKTYLREGCKTDRAVLVYAGVRVKHPAVPAGDGEPLEVGQPVWHKSGNAHGVVESIDAGSLMHTVRYRSDDGEEYRDAAKDLTHERPVADTWERLEEDAEEDPCGYFGFDEEETCGRCPASGKNCEQTMVRDLVRRARALAERGE